MSNLRLFVLTLAFGLVSAIGHAQQTTIEGTVLSQDRAVVASATVTLLTPTLETVSVTTTDDQGRYAFRQVPAGEYVVRVVVAGFRPSQKSITTGTGRSQTLDFLLSRGSRARPPAPPPAPPPPPPPPPPPAPAPPPSATGAPTAGTAPRPDAGKSTNEPFSRVAVFYATDRARARDAVYGADFSRERNDADDLQYGHATVTIPRNHKVGALESPSLLHLEFKPDTAKHVALLRSEAVDKSMFYREVTTAASGREMLVFIHGYNVTFENALRRTAQLAYDLQFSGPAVAYTWPAQDSVARYLIAQSNVDWSKPHLVQFLTELASRSGAQKIHVIVHSLGNRIFAHAVDAMMTANPTQRPIFHTVVMAAADIDVAEFKQLALKMKQSTESLTLYVSATDKALKASKTLASYSRVGQGVPPTPVLIAGIDTVDATDVDNGFFWSIDHSYFGDSSSVLGDLWQLIRCDWRVTQRDGVKSDGDRDPRLWRLVAGVPHRDECTASRAPTQ